MGSCVELFVTDRRLGGPKPVLGMCSRSFLFLHISFLIRPLEDLKPCLGINEISSSFFSLLLEILLLEGQSSLPVVSVLEKSDVHQSFQIVELFSGL